MGNYSNMDLYPEFTNTCSLCNSMFGSKFAHIEICKNCSDVFKNREEKINKIISGENR